MSIILRSYITNQFGNVVEDQRVDLLLPQSRQVSVEMLSQLVNHLWRRGEDEDGRGRKEVGNNKSKRGGLGRSKNS